MDETNVKLTGHPGILKGWVYSYTSILTKILNTSLERDCFANLS